MQVIHDYGNYHIFVQSASDEEAAAIGSRIDVENTGKWIQLGTGIINGVTSNLGALDKNFAENMNIKVIAGKYPTRQNEIMLEQWAMRSLHQDLKVNDTVEIILAGNVKRKFIVSGIYNDLGHTKAKGVPGIFLSVAGAHEVMPEKKSLYLIKFKDGVNIIEAEKDM